MCIMNVELVVCNHCVWCVMVYRESEREREREEEVVASVVTAWWRSKGARGRCLCAPLL